MAKRRGMYIKNVSEKLVQIVMEHRTLEMTQGEITMVTAAEVRDPVLRENLQIRTIAIVRPATEDEEAAFFSTAAPGTEEEAHEDTGA